MKRGRGGIREEQFGLQQRVLGGATHKQSPCRCSTGEAGAGMACRAPADANAGGLKTAATKAYFERAFAQWEAAGTTAATGKAVV
jgi:hypothetical protein